MATADDFVDDYWNISVGSSTVSINKYLIGGKFGGEALKTKQSNIQKVYDVAGAKGLARRAACFGRAKIGKASPDDLEHILNLGVKAKLFGEDDAQDWADRNLGVDCTGFAVAYLASEGYINLDKYSGGVSCPFLFDKAKRSAKANGDDSPLVWDLDDVQPDDMILWMYDNGVETRSPGHISIVYDTDQDNLLCAESNGSDDGAGHSGPRLTTRKWKGKKSVGGKTYVDLDGAQVIVVRTPDTIA